MPALSVLKAVGAGSAVLFFLCYAYQFFYIPVAWIPKKKPDAPSPAKRAAKRRYAVLICARNEEAVIGNLLDTVRRQTYGAEYLTVFVMADNCTDRTAEIARRNGAAVYTRTSTDEVGKGYALRQLTRQIRQDCPEGFDGYFVFDADNLLSPGYVEAMDRKMDEDPDVVTGYRNSTNYGDSWLSAGSALWFLRESRYLNGAREKLGLCCTVSGTGFLLSRREMERIGEWHWHLLTEDVEYTADCALHGIKIRYCPEAELYDEQPTCFAQSWRQRIRWSKGYFQVMRHYGSRLIRGIFAGDFSCFDLTMAIFPAFFLSVFSGAVFLLVGVLTLCRGENLLPLLAKAARSLGGVLIPLFFIGLFTAVTERKHIHASPARKIGSLFTFPLFLLTYLPISVVSLFTGDQWKPIAHRGKRRVTD